MPPFRRWIDAGFDPETTEPELLRRVRLLVASCGLMLVAGLGLALLGGWIAGPVLGLLGLGVALGYGGVLPLLRRTRRPDLCGHIAIALLFILLVVLNARFGGLHAASFSGFYLVPLAGALMVSLRAGWIWAGASLLAAGVFWAAPGTPPPELHPVPLGDLATALIHGGVILVVGALATVFARAQRGTEMRLREIYAKAQALAFYDPLTGLPNRQSFQERLDQTLRLAARSGRKAALLFVDLDGFKTVNDTLGHGAGDRLLCEVAGRFQRSVRGSDVVAVGDVRPAGSEGSESDAAAISPVSRLGGDEFTVLLGEVSGTPGASIVAQRILDALQAPVVIEGREVYASASIGIAVYPEHGLNAETLLRSADTAMYHAKSRGRSNYQFFSLSQGAAGQRRVEIEGRLRRALEEDLFVLHYQPIRSLRSGRVVAAEALLRWTDPELGPVAPAEFIPVAEECGLIVRVGEWVLRHACGQLRCWQEAGHRAVRVSVNMSAEHVRYHGMLQTVAMGLARAGLSGTLLEIEITESALMSDDHVTRETLAGLSELGVSLALDDFGTGYSSISYLKRHPIDCVKIDRSFVAGLPDAEDDVAIVSAIIAMAQSLGVRVVAEGVENEAQMRCLHEKGCHEIQGFLLSPPVPPEAFAHFLEQEK